jgi:phosphoglycerate dehydrogenase-like enzyme
MTGVPGARRWALAAAEQEKELSMQLGMVGLGRMGANLVRRLMKAGHDCVVFDVNPDKVEALEREGAIGAGSLDDLAPSSPSLGRSGSWSRPAASPARR